MNITQAAASLKGLFTSLTPRARAYAALGAAAAVLIAGLAAAAVWSDHRVTVLETRSREAETAANDAMGRATRLDERASDARQQIDRLEAEVGTLKQNADKQEETLKQLHLGSGDARARVRGARGTRSKPAAEPELCQELAKLGHPCA